MPEGKIDDLMEAAIRAVDAAREDLLLAKASDNKALLRQVSISMVHGALLAERQRCAEIAQGYGDNPDWPGETWIAGAISEAILHRGALNHD